MTEALLAWFDAHRRDLPWRRPEDRADPYRVLVAEVMLQQTRVDAVVPYYRRWLERFPTLTALATAPEQEVLRAWEGLGYYRRARNLRAAARIVLAEHGGAVPAEPDALRRLPGVGRYTAAAVLALAHGKPGIAVDGNVRRVASRLAGSAAALSDADAERTLGPLACGPRGAIVAEALIELGAMVCAPRAPACGRCPLRVACVAAASPDPSAFPARRRRAAPPLRRRWALVAFGEPAAAEREPASAAHDMARRGSPAAPGCGAAAAGSSPAGAGAGRGAGPVQLWLVRRPPDGLLGGLWGFPQTDAPPSPAGTPALAPGGAAASTSPALVRHAYSHFRLELLPVLVPLATLRAEAPDAVPVGLHDLPRLPLSTVDRAVLRRLRDAGLLPDATP